MKHWDNVKKHQPLISQEYNRIIYTQLINSRIIISFHQCYMTNIIAEVIEFLLLSQSFNCFIIYEH